MPISLMKKVYSHNGFVRKTSRLSRNPIASSIKPQYGAFPRNRCGEYLRFCWRKIGKSNGRIHWYCRQYLNTWAANLCYGLPITFKIENFGKIDDPFLGLPNPNLYTYIHVVQIALGSMCLNCKYTNTDLTFNFLTKMKLTAKNLKFPLCLINVTLNANFFVFLLLPS